MATYSALTTYIAVLHVLMISIDVVCPLQRRNTKIAYGGMLSEIEKLDSEDAQIQHAAEYAVKFALLRQPHTILTSKSKVPSDEHLADSSVCAYIISAARRLQLVYTADDTHPYVYEVYNRDTASFNFKSLTWGVTLSFRISWSQSCHTWTHMFVVTVHNEQYHIFQHTFYEAKDRQNDAALGLCQGCEEPSVVTASYRAKSPILADASVKDCTHTDKNLQQDSGPLSSNNLVRAHIVSDNSCQRVGDFQWWQSGKGDQMCDILSKNSQEGHDYIFRTPRHSNLEMNRNSGVTFNKCDNNRCDNNRWDDNKCDNKTDVTINILCYNIWNTNTVNKGPGDYSDRLDRMAKLMSASNADVIGLQEVRFHDGCCDDLGASQMDHVMSKLDPDWQFVFRPAQIQQSELPRRVEEGPAVLSRHHVARVRHVLLHRNPDDAADGHQRLLLHVELDVACFGSVHILNTHLSLSHLARATSVIQIWQYITKLDGPVFLMGDLNAESHNDEVKFLQGRGNLHGSITKDFHDVWSLMHPGETGYTFNTLDKELTKRIDFLFLRDHSLVSVLDTRLVDDGGRGAGAASDHIGLVTKINLKLKS